MSKPKFYQAVLQEIEGDVLAKVYPENVKKYGSPMVTMAERMGMRTEDLMAAFGMKVEKSGPSIK